MASRRACAGPSRCGLSASLPRDKIGFVGADRRCQSHQKVVARREPRSLYPADGRVGDIGQLREPGLGQPGLAAKAPE